MMHFMAARRCARRGGVAIAAGLIAVAAMPAASQSYTYRYTSTDPGRTSGSFTLAATSGTFGLTSFTGVVNGVTYSTSTVGLAQTSTGSYYLGALVNGIDYYSGPNDFTETGAFIPGTATVYDSFQYYNSSGSASGIAVIFTNQSPVPPATYSYAYTSLDPARTSGTFTVTPNGSSYTLSAFAGKVNGVSYTTATVGLADNSGNGTYSLGGLVNGIDYYAGPNDFAQSGAFTPGTGGFSDSFQYYVSSGMASGIAVTFSPISGVPEPASWGMMILGMAGIGAVLRRAARPRSAAVHSAP